MYEGKIIQKNEFTITQILDKLKKSKNFKKAGAITAFIGVVRSTSKKGEAVKGLYIEAWEEKANQSLTQIAKDISSNQGITDVIIYHILGELNVGEDIVYVFIAGDHRQNIFPVLKEAVERYKKEAEVWKKEILESGDAYWTEEL